MESVYALGCLLEGVAILVLLGLVISQRITISKYQEDYLSRIAAQRFAESK